MASDNIDSNANCGGKIPQVTKSTGVNKTPAGVGSARTRSTNRPKMNGVVLDGIMPRRSALPARVVVKSAQGVHMQARRSFALMRQAVARPKQIPDIKPDIKRSPVRSHQVSRFKQASKVSPDKLARAKQINKHSKVSRFGQSLAPFPRAIVSPIVPAINKFSSRVSSAARLSSGHPRLDGVTSPVTNAMTITRPLPAIAATQSHQRLEAMLDRALEQADAHKQMLKVQLSRSSWRRLRKPRNLAMALFITLSVASLLIFAYMKIPAVSVRIASIQAGISARAPAYIPAGFSLSKTSYKYGDVSLIFSGGSGSFTVSQQQSNLNSESLLGSVVAPSSKLYQASQYNGVTIYTYGGTGASDSNSTWVNHDIHYTITNNAELSTDQLIKIAQGL